MTRVLDIEALQVEIPTRDGVVRPVRGVTLAVDAGETLALVGESGCGKSMTALAAIGLLPVGARIGGGEIRLRERRLNDLDEAGWNRLRGGRIGMVFQNPMSSFNPTMRVGAQIAETLVAHRGLSWRDAESRAVTLLDRMQIPSAAQRARQFPFEFSGGMLQRAMIAMAVACEPMLLIADEPTTALDVTVQVEVLALLRDLQQERGMALLLITHDLGVVAQVADCVAVMYAGEVVEQGPVDTLFHATAHPYTLGLKRSLPGQHVARGAGGREPLAVIRGSPPDLIAPPAGCGFYVRCEQAMRICESGAVPLFELAAGHCARCWLHHPQRSAQKVAL
jgi:oligopeptide/dipeptide ABC transporter ATP-binding protein